MPPGKNLLAKAVHHHPSLAFRGLLERLFTAWFGGFFYSQMWEDPLVDLEALELSSQSRMLVISSAGCNALAYLTKEPASIAAVDINPAQVYLTRLKLAAMTHLPSHQDFFDFFGCADLEANRQRYERYVRDHLDLQSRNFWDGGSLWRRRLLGPRIDYFTRNLYKYSSLGYFLRFVHALGRIFGCEPRDLLKARTREEQELFFDKRIAPIFDRRLIRMALRNPCFLFGVGIPPQQLRLLQLETGESLADLCRERLRELACRYPVADNCFLWQGFALTYDREHARALPEYLKKDNYTVIKKGIPSIQTHVESLQSYLQRQPEGSLDRFVLLDSQDWMRPEDIRQLWSEIARVGRPGTRIVFRTIDVASPVETLLPPKIKARFTYQQELSRSLFAKDRAAIYGGFHAYVMSA